jgi:hypothetical protein
MSRKKEKTLWAQARTLFNKSTGKKKTLIKKSKANPRKAWRTA